MDSSSIVSFNNDSTFQTTLKADGGNSSVHELALHAMRDRCLLLQRRINALESDNMRLKLDMTKYSESPSIPIEDEKLNLQKKIAELTKQKSQLMHHVFMVSCENKNLWNKLSTFNSPERPKLPLLRSNTYVHSTPKSSATYQEKYSESSLEDISLKLINSYIQEKSQLVEQYEQMAQLQENVEVLNIDSIGFTYFEEPATDSLKEICHQTEKLQTLKKELAQQEKDLQFVITRMESVLEGGYKCPSCLSNNIKITQEHKEIETSDSLVNFATPVDSTSYVNNVNETSRSSNESIEKVNHDDKICPMCGEVFNNGVTFNEFQGHVEKHFIGEIESNSMENNIENAVQDSFDVI